MALFTLIAAWIAVCLWTIVPGAGVWVLALFFFPLAIANSRRSVTPPNLLLVGLLSLFILSALIGVWAAYDTDAAWQKFWILLGGVLLCIVLSVQPIENLPWAGILAGLSALLVGFSFLLGHDWNARPADFEALSTIERSLSQLRPDWNFIPSDPNVAGGVTGLAIPFVLVSTWSFLHRRQALISLVGGFLSIVLIAIIIMTSSRGAWFGLVSTFTAVGVVWLIKKSSHKRRRLFSSAAVLIILVAGLSLLLNLNRTSYSGFLSRITSASTRIDLWRDVPYLIADFPFTGGGLGSFSGLYSRLILVIPYVFFQHSHNLYLDLTLELGILGVAAFLILNIFLAIKLVRAIWIWKSADDQSALGFAIASLIAIGGLMVHGMLDDPLFGAGGTALLFVPIGIGSASLLGSSAFVERKTDPTPRWQWIYVGIGGLALISIMFIYSKELKSFWHANLGAVEMSKVELQEWPDGGWNLTLPAADISKASRKFDLSLTHYPSNSSVLYRKGLLATRDGDFGDAVRYLELAYNKSPGHRGIRKSLGYNYVWEGELGAALPLLLTIPESRYELGIYSWWWATQGRPDLSGAAAEMERALRNEGAPHTSDPLQSD